MPGTSWVTDAPSAGDPGAPPVVGAVTDGGGGRSVSVGGGCAVAGESNSLPEDPCRVQTTGARPPPGARPTFVLAEPQREGVGAHSPPRNGQYSDGTPYFGRPRVQAAGGSHRMTGAPAACSGSMSSMKELSLEAEERQRRKLQLFFGVTPENVVREQLQRATRCHCSLDATPAPGRSGPSLHWVGRAAAKGLSRSAADTKHLRHLVQVLWDALEEAFTVASDGTLAPGGVTAVAMALSAAQGPSPPSASAREPAMPGLSFWRPFGTFQRRGPTTRSLSLRW